MLVLFTATASFAQDKKLTPVPPTGKETRRNSSDTTAKPIKAGRIGDPHETTGDGLKQVKRNSGNEGRSGSKK